MGGLREDGWAKPFAGIYQAVGGEDGKGGGEGEGGLYGKVGHG